ncbi:MAG: M60 family metallopeptidase, partial [Culicoidibacterales bacterium]
VTLATTSQRLLIGTTATTVAEVAIPGAFLSGDVNQDGVIDSTDYQAVQARLGKKETGYDLNFDGTIDIADLVIVHKNIGQTVMAAEVEATAPIIDVTQIEATVTDGTTLEGDIQTLFAGNATQPVALTSETVISAANPVEMAVQLTDKTRESLVAEEIQLTVPSESAPTSGMITINGESYPFTLEANTQVMSDSTMEQITVDLGKQVALSEITITITGSKGNKNLAEIAKIELLNNVYQEIPAPTMAIPNITAIESSIDVYGGILDIEWERVANVTGYELKLEEVDSTGKVKSTKIYKTTDAQLKIEKLNPYATYRLTMQALNREWKSGTKVLTPEDQDGIAENVDANYNPITWEADSSVEFKIIPGTTPDKPEGISVTGEMKGLTVSWQANKKALEQKVEYRQVGTTQWIEATDWLTGTSTRIENLAEDVMYEIRMKAKNHLGESGYSAIYLGTTTSVTIPVIPTYGLINRSLGKGVLSAGIESVAYNSNAVVSSPEAVVDNDGLTYFQYNNWDTGIYGNRGPVITFTEPQTIDTISLVSRLDVNGATPYNVQVRYKDDAGNWQGLNTTLEKKNKYIFIKLPEAITTKEIQVNPSVYGGNVVSISELRFYQHGTLNKEVQALFTDAMQVELQPEVTLEMIEALEKRVNTLDPVNLEYHPNRETLLTELQRAKDIYQDVALSDEIVTLDASIQNGSSALNITNKWQSLGYSVRSGDEITIYMGTSDTSRKIEIAVRQPFAESGKYESKAVTLQPGKNVITIPTIQNLDAENGGTLYVRTTWNNDKVAPTYKLRISGAIKTPLLDVNNLIGDEVAMKAEIRTYLQQLKKFVNDLPNLYPTETDKTQNIYPYDEATAVLNTTDIEGDRFTLTLPATQVLKGITQGLTSEDAQVERLYQTILAWEQFIQLTYAKKGVYEQPVDLNSDGTIDSSETAHFNTHRAPRTRINIKYQRMFAGAAGYASSDHIGIQFGLVPSLMQGVPYEFDEAGKITNADEAHFFGWLIGHEMGHVVDISKRTYSETSNNVLALMDQTFDDQDLSRLETGNVYPKIYDKVTSGSTGISSDVFVTLGMFWQLHLAYDDATLASMLQTSVDNDLSNDAFYTKMNQLYRTLPSEMANLNKDQLLIRIASDAANRDLRGFFQSWGIEADEDTAIYLTQKGYAAETRPIQYLNDQARRVRMEGQGAMATGTEVVASFADGIQAGDRLNTKTVPMTFTTTQSQSEILGYEIIVNDEVAGFVQQTGEVTTYEFDPSPVNNRTFTIAVRAYDYQLNATPLQELGTIKISHDGTINQTNWLVSSNETVAQHSNTETVNTEIKQLIDGDASTHYTVNKTTGDPYVIIDVNKSMPIVGFRYTAAVETNNNLLTKLFASEKLVGTPLSKYEIQVSQDGQTWKSVKAGTMTTSTANPTQTVYFEKAGTSGGNQYWLENAQYVKIIAKGAASFTSAELELLSPTGDTIEIGTQQADGQFANGIGTLKTAYEYAPGKTIPAGSLIVTGDYRGYPIYNVPLVLDENGDNLAYNAKAILLAEVPEGTVPTEVAQGTWIYWVEPEHLSEVTATQMYAELYRINDITTLEGQRLVADTFKVEIPTVLPEIEITQAATRNISELYEFEANDLQNVKEQANEETN